MPDDTPLMLGCRGFQGIQRRILGELRAQLFSYSLTSGRPTNITIWYLSYLLWPLTPIQLGLSCSGHRVPVFIPGEETFLSHKLPSSPGSHLRQSGKQNEDRHDPPTGNSNLVYAIIRKRGVFHQLANLPTDPPSIHKALQRRRKTPEPLSRAGSQEGASMEGSRPAAPAEPGTLKTSLVATPGLDAIRLGECGTWLEMALLGGV